MKAGNWEFFPDNLTIYNAKADYEIDVEGITRSSHLLDWIFQIAAKQSDHDLLGMIKLFERIAFDYFGTNAQGVFCPFGADMVIDWKARTYHERKTGENRSRI